MQRFFNGNKILSRFQFLFGISILVQFQGDTVPTVNQTSHHINGEN